MRLPPFRPRHRQIDRAQVEQAIEALIEILDQLDGDPDLETDADLEDDTSDCCEARDDTGTPRRVEVYVPADMRRVAP